MKRCGDARRPGEASARQAAARLGGFAEQSRPGALLACRARAAGEHLSEAEAAYRPALEEYTRDKAPVRMGRWSQNNLGNTLNTLGARKNDLAMWRKPLVFRSALEVRTRESVPVNGATARSISAMRCTISDCATTVLPNLRRRPGLSRCAHELTRDRTPGSAGRRPRTISAEFFS